MSSDEKEGKNIKKAISDAEPKKASTKRSSNNSAPKEKETLNARGMPVRLRKKNKYYEEHQTQETTEAESSEAEIESDSAPAKKAKTTPRAAKHKIPAIKTIASKKIKKEKEDSSDHEEEDMEDGASNDDDSDFEATKVPEKKKPGRKPGRPPLNKSVNKSLNTTQSSEVQKIPQIDKKACQRVGLRLRNLLKLPKAHKFVMYEFFYSTIDQHLLVGGSDFEMCLRQTFPNLKTRLMTKIEWNKIRGVLGKPRRMSQKVSINEIFLLSTTY